jgi:hypothetical protein
MTNGKFARMTRKMDCERQVQGDGTAKKGAGH